MAREGDALEESPLKTPVISRSHLRIRRLFSFLGHEKTKNFALM